MTTPLKLLVVEDDPNLGTLVAEYLEAKGYVVELQRDGQQGFQAYRRGGHDLLLLDVMMPVKDGLTLAKEIRKENPQVPIIFLTAKSMRQDAINGFLVGADDYIHKPFSMEELQLRIGAVLRRVHGIAEKEEAPTKYEIGLYHFDLRKQLLTLDEQQRKLTTKETELLRMLCVHRNGLLERSVALKEIWGDDSYFNGRSMDVYIAKLRKYFKDDPAVEIVNVHGKGFRLTDKSE